MHVQYIWLYVSRYLSIHQSINLSYLSIHTYICREEIEVLWYLANFIYFFPYNHRQPQWTADEAIMARNITSEVHFFKANDLSTVAEKKVLAKLKSFSLSPSKNTHYVTFFMPSEFIFILSIHFFMSVCQKCIDIDCVIYWCDC